MVDLNYYDEYEYDHDIIGGDFISIHDCLDRSSGYGRYEPSPYELEDYHIGFRLYMVPA